MFFKAKNVILSDRTRNIVKHIGLSSLYKIGSIVIGFLLVPLSIKYLGSEQYGLWLTLFGFISWFNFFDFGIGHGLRNKLAEALSNNDHHLAKIYVSTAYFSVFILSIFSIGLFLMIYPFVDWSKLFNTHTILIEKIILVIYIVFAMNLTLKLLTVVFYANHDSSKPGLLNFLGQFLIIVVLYTAYEYDVKSFLAYSIIVSLAQMIIFVLATLFYFLGSYNYIAPNLNYFHWKYVKDIFNLGSKFFLIQISAIILYSTDNFIINYLYGGAEVTIYNLAFKYFSVLTMVISIVLTPYWSGFTDAYVKNDLLWIKSAIANLGKIIIGMVGVGLIMILFSDSIYLIWVGSKIEVPYLLTILMGINTMIMMLAQLVSTILNGIGKVKLQMYLGIFGAMINIPLSLFLATTMGLGTSGVILATLLCNLLAFMVYPVQVYKIINRTAKGIWNA
ncbi:MAG: polysaccharide biosynthesis C-terminal domain-containing protein [Sulfuricurvum sp.]|nr:polysaccharide biosynthesis C-terminal domain-containing protein [Sulfuricurvum sp.]